jgi:hypothetical protein
MEYEIIEHGIYIHDYDRIIIQGDRNSITKPKGKQFPLSNKAKAWCWMGDKAECNMIAAGNTVFCREIKANLDRCCMELEFRCGQYDTYLVYWPDAVLAKIRFIRGKPMSYLEFKEIVLDRVHPDLLNITRSMWPSQIEK